VYTQCPDCATVFRVTAEALRVAQGDVRCGVCSTSFNALENLSEQAFEAAPADTVPSPDDSMTVEELPGAEDIELSAPVELAAVPDAPPEPEPAPPEDEAASPEPQDAAADIDSTDEHPVLVLDESEELAPAESIVLETVEPERVPAPATVPRILIPEEMRRRLAEEAAAREEAARLFEPEEPDDEDLADRRWPWVAGIAALALLLLVQVVHARRNDLVRSPSLGPALASLYDVLGLSVLAPTDLAAYELRQWGAASDPREANRLMLRASVVNRASYSQPLPLLRLTLQDRFGGTLGQRDIGPADYLPGSGTQTLLEPGQRADALIRIVDPGVEAVGFELDVCLPADGGVRCAGEIKTARQ
jgi:predicted Zn finger-like uncharacterized protein